MRQTIAAIFIVLCLSLIPCSPAAQAQDDLPPPPEPDRSNIIEPRFGAVEAYHEAELADQAGFGWTRILFYWSELERGGPDDWNWFHAPLERIDREIEGGREVIGLIQNTPAWATDGLPDAGVPRGLYLPLDDPDNVWASFVRELFTKYDGRINRWIIWNEPDIVQGDYGFLWEGTTEEYYQLLKVAYLIAEEVNPDIQIHLGATTYWHNPNYINEFLAVVEQDPTAAEHGYYFDAVSTHVYFKPETTLGIIASLQQQLDAHGLSDKPIWMVETNAPPYDDPQQEWVNPDFLITQEMQASYLIQMFALTLSTGIEYIEIYKWADQPPRPPGFEPYGMLRSDSTARPAYYAFLAIIEHMSGFEEVQRLERDEMFTITLDRGDKTTRVLWSRLPEGLQVEVPALADEAVVVEQQGNETTVQAVGGVYQLELGGGPCINGEECLVGGKPLMLVEDAPADLANWQDYTPQLVGVYPEGTLTESRVVEIDGDNNSSRDLAEARLPFPPLLIVVAGIVLLTGFSVYYSRHAIMPT